MTDLLRHSGGRTAIARDAGTATLAELESLRSESNPEVFFEALLGLAERLELAEAAWKSIRPRLALELWRDLLASRKPIVQLDAIRAVGLHQVRELLPELRRLSQGQYLIARGEAKLARLRVALGHGDAAELESLLDAGDLPFPQWTEALQIRAARVLLHRGAHAGARERLTMMLASSFPESRLRAAEGFLEIGETEAAEPVLRSLLRDSDEVMRHRASALWLRHFGTTGRLSTRVPS